MNRNHPNYPYYHKKQIKRSDNSGGTWKYRFESANKKNLPRTRRGNIDIIKLLSALGINDPKLDMLIKLMNGKELNIQKLLYGFMQK